MNWLTSSYYSICANSGHRNTCECCHYHTQANDDDSETCKNPPRKVFGSGKSRSHQYFRKQWSESCHSRVGLPMKNLKCSKWSQSMEVSGAPEMYWTLKLKPCPGIISQDTAGKGCANWPEKENIHQRNLSIWKPRAAMCQRGPLEEIP